MKETSKSVLRRIADNRFATRFFVGMGIDIGCGTDPISMYGEMFPRMTGLKAWDVPDGDAQFMKGVADETYDFVHSSHCLEHLHDPAEGLANWLRILKPGGHMIVLVPDEDLYEGGQFPSTYNKDHKATFTIKKSKSWSPRSYNLLELLGGLGPAADIVKLELLDATHRYRLPRFDQTLTPIGESAIEFVLRRRPQAEIDAGGRLPPPGGITRNDFLFLTGIPLPEPKSGG
jgi:SAM-dependent methyltransferase